MEYSRDFMSPTGKILLCGIYNEKTKEVTFELARKVYYPQDMSFDSAILQAEEFCKRHKAIKNNIKEANAYLQELGIKETFIC